MKNIVIIILCGFCHLNFYGQTAYIGDKFGGRLWYYPTNFSVGSYSAHTVCGDSNQLYSWGTNIHGELGYKSLPSQIHPVAVKGMTNIHYYSAGYVAGAIKYDKSGWVWGKFMNKPTKVINDAVYLDAGENSVCFIKEEGTVWSIGENIQGAFGNGFFAGMYTIPQKMRNIDNAVRVANGKLTTVILLKTGKVKVCGSNYNYGLGLPNRTEKRDTPVYVKGLNDIVAIASNRHVNLALDKNGDVYIWGYGHGNWGGKQGLRKVEGLKNIVAISGRNDGAHFLALDSSGNCYSWGHNYYNQLGTNDDHNRGLPTLVATDVIDILAGESFSYVVKKDWSLWCTGSSNNGGSIWLTNQIRRSRKFIEIDLDKGDIGICRPEYARLLKRTEEARSLCSGDTLFIFGKAVFQKGIYIDTLVDRYGQDSIHTVVVSEYPKNIDSLYFTICRGEDVIVNNNHYAEEGHYTDTLSNIYGCDSVVDIFVNVLPRSWSFQEVHLCPGTTYAIGSKLYSSSGGYMDTFINSLGCDSIISINLKIEDNYTIYTYKRICSYDSFLFQNTMHFSNKEYVYKYQSIWGCDSTYILTLDTFTDNRCYSGVSYIPNSFTPNGDLLNDDFGFVGRNIVDVRLRIYNIWGEKMFDGSGKNPRWNGLSISGNSPCIPGVYSYFLETISLENIRKSYSGTVTLIK